MGAEPAAGSTVTFLFYDGNVETFTVLGILNGDDTAMQLSVFFPKAMPKTEVS